MATIQTEKGSPCSKKWDAEWIDAVNALEHQAGRRCCGARCPDHEPCLLKPSHKNGRCRYHGGVPGIGAPKGNANARLHGLYSRRIQQCGGHCPLWNSCPLAGPDVMELPEKKRPECPYEREEYDALTELDMESMNKPSKYFDDSKNRMRGQIVMLRENLKTLQIMVTRAAAAIHGKGMTQETTVQSDNYCMTTGKPSAFLQAYHLLTREHRQTLHQYRALVGDFGLPDRPG